MNPARFLPLASLFLIVSQPASAQWKTETYQLHGGWNAIYVHGDATYTDITSLFSGGAALNVSEIWRWNPNPSAVQFTESPQIQSPGTPEWSVWKRSDPGASTLSTLSGNAAYLVLCTGAAGDNYPLSIKQRPLPPRNQWVREGANLFGFQTPSASPTFSNYFATFPAPLAAGSDVFKYLGGPLGTANPIRIYSFLSEPLERNKAYWFESEVVSDFHAPIQVEISDPAGLSFGDTKPVLKLTLKNRSSEEATAYLTPQPSESAPAGQTAVTGPVPLILRGSDGAGNISESPLSETLQVSIPGSGSVSLLIRVDRTHATLAAASPGDLFGSLLRINDDQGLMEIDLPVTAVRGSLAGLWMGDVNLTQVSSQVSNPARAIAALGNGSVTSITVEGSGGFGYTSAPEVTVAAPDGSGSTATAVAHVANGSVQKITLTQGGSGYTGAPQVTVEPPPPLSGTETPSPMKLRTLMHVADDGTSTLLSQAFVGPLSGTGEPGVCTAEGLLDEASKADSIRLSSAHLPLDQAVTSGSGSVAIPGSLTRVVNISYNDPTNPFVHQYHPDHDNLDARFQPVALPSGVTPYNATMADGADAPAIQRTCRFDFFAFDPVTGLVPLGWGSTVLGGVYTEVMEGVHKNPIQLQGTFELRRVSDIGTLTTP